MTSANLLVMGVSGAGKTSLGQALAAALGADFTDADDLHRDVDRVDLRIASTVMRVQVISTGRILFERDPFERAAFEATASAPIAR